MKIDLLLCLPSVLLMFGILIWLFGQAGQAYSNRLIILTRPTITSFHALVTLPMFYLMACLALRLFLVAALLSRFPSDGSTIDLGRNLEMIFGVHLVLLGVLVTWSLLGAFSFRWRKFAASWQ